MRGNNTNINNDVIRMEKKSTNKTGLIFLMLLFLVAFGYGGYYLWKNWNNINWDFSLPWNTKETDYDGRTIIDGNKGNSSNSSSSSKNNKLYVPTMEDQKFGDDGAYNIYITNLEADDKGYTFDVELQAIDGNYSLNCLIQRQLLILSHQWEFLN